MGKKFVSGNQIVASALVERENIWIKKVGRRKARLKIFFISRNPNAKFSVFIESQSGCLNFMTDDWVGSLSGYLDVPLSRLIWGTCMSKPSVYLCGMRNCLHSLVERLYCLSAWVSVCSPVQEYLSRNLSSISGLSQCVCQSV